MPAELDAFAHGFPLMLLQGALALVLLALFGAVYIFLSPHKEVALIRESNTAAAVSFAGVVLGLAIPLAGAVVVSTSLVELLLWGSAVSVLALLAFRLIDFMLAGLPQRMREGEIGPAIVLVAGRLAAAILIVASLAV